MKKLTFIYSRVGKIQFILFLHSVIPDIHEWKSGN